MQFFKAHALGNDFIITEKKELAGCCEFYDIARRICHRHFGAGADGFVILEKLDGKTFSFRIFNADGSEAEISGNGIRCAAAYIFYNKLVEGEEIILRTTAGERHVWLKKQDGKRFIFRNSMGKPRLDSRSIPFDDGAEHERIVDYPLSVRNLTFPVTVISVGNPHCVLFFEKLPSQIEWKELGKEIEEHPFFPERTNVEFVKVIDRNTIQVLIWERGVGETYSSGSGSSAAAYACYLKGLTSNRVKVKTPAGDVFVEINDEIFVEGPAEIIYRGEWFE